MVCGLWSVDGHQYQLWQLSQTSERCRFHISFRLALSASVRAKTTSPPHISTRSAHLCLLRSTVGWLDTCSVSTRRLQLKFAEQVLLAQRQPNFFLCRGAEPHFMVTELFKLLEHFAGRLLAHLLCCCRGHDTTAAAVATHLHCRSNECMCRGWEVNMGPKSAAVNLAARAAA